MMINSIVRTLLYATFSIGFCQTVFANERYVWTNVEYIFTEPEQYIEEEETCQYVKKKVGDSSYSEEKRKKICTTQPARYIPPKTIKKILKVHIDCKDKTYDAKGDNRGWRKIELQNNVLKSAVKPCVKAGYSMENYLDQLALEDREGVLLSIKTKKKSKIYQKCLSDSLNSLDKYELENTSKKEKLAFLSKSQLYGYYLRMKSKLPSQCKELSESSELDLSQIEIDLYVLEPIKYEAFQYVLDEKTQY